MFEKAIRLGMFMCVMLSVARANAADAPEKSAPMKAGFAERDITPEVGMEQPGGYGKAISRIIHDPCKVRASVFDDGKSRVAIVGLDALGIRRDSVERARETIEQRCGILAGSVLISASHSHSAGPTLGALPGEWGTSSDFVKSLVYEKSTNANPKYLERVETAIADAVVEANEKRVDAKCAAGFGSEGTVSFNRRFRMKNGLSMTHPGQGNPDIVEPAGPIDPQVGVIGAWDSSGKLIGCIVNFACHATTSPGGTSADYICYIEETIRGLMGEKAIVVFLPGAAGDVTQVDNRSTTATPQFGEAASRRVGGSVGAEAVKTLLSLYPSAGLLAPLDAKSQMLHIQRRVPKPEKVAAALELVKKPGAEQHDPTTWTFAKETVLLAQILKREPVADFEVQAIQVGPAVFLACPAEYFCQYGLDLKKGSTFPVTMPVSLANGCIGYVPTEDAMGPHGGGYETRLTAYSNLIPTGGTQIRDTLLSLSKSLTPGPLPKAPPLVVEKPATGWTYGNQPPELE